eukprot:428658-Rhodomonas_salina.2
MLTQNQRACFRFCAAAWQTVSLTSPPKRYVVCVSATCEVQICRRVLRLQVPAQPSLHNLGVRMSNAGNSIGGVVSGLTNTLCPHWTG